MSWPVDQSYTRVSVGNLPQETARRLSLQAP